MTYVYNPKTKTYNKVEATRPHKNYDFSLSPELFAKKYLSYRYSPQEFNQLAQSGYVGSYGNGVLGIKAPAYDVKFALGQIRQGKTPNRFELPTNFVGNNLIPIQTLPRPTALELLQWNKRASKFNLQQYIAQYGHPPSEDSAYYQFYKPTDAAAPALDAARGEAVKEYQVGENWNDFHTLWALGNATKDPNIMAMTAGGSSALHSDGKEWSPADRAKVRQVLRDFGLTAAGPSTMAPDLGSKYLLPANITNPAAFSAPDKAVGSGGAAFSTTDKAVAGGVAAATTVAPILAFVAQNAVLQDLSTNPEGPLAPTKAADVTPLSFVGNIFKGLARAGLGFPMGVKTLVEHPIESTKLMLKDYGKRYGALWGDPDSNFIESTLEDPTMVLFDALGVIPAFGAAAKGTQIAKVAAVTSRGVAAGTLEATSKGIISSALTVEDLLQVERIAQARALDNLSRPFKDIMREGPFTELEFNRIKNLSQEDLLVKSIERQSALAAKQASIGVRTESGRVSRQGTSIRSFAKAQRAAINGDISAAAQIVEHAPEGFNGMNSAYVPNAMDTAAAFFEPRSALFNLESIMRNTTDPVTGATLKTVGEALKLGDNISPELNADALIRYSGSPIARGAQKAFFQMQRRIGLKALDSEGNTVLRAASGRLVNMPLIGFNYRYARGILTHANSVHNLVARELLNNKAYEELIKRVGNLEPHEEWAIISQAHGNIIDPNVAASIARRRLNILQQADGGSPSEALNLKNQIVMFENPDLQAKFASITADMLSDAPSERAQTLNAARDAFRAKRDKAYNEMGFEVSSADLPDLERIYAPVLDGFALRPDDIANSIRDALNRMGKKSVIGSKKAGFSSRFARFVVNAHLLSHTDLDLPFSMTMPGTKTASEALTLEEHIKAGTFGDRPIADVRAAYKMRLEAREATRLSAEDPRTIMDSGNHPFFIATGHVNTSVGTFIRGHHLYSELDTNSSGVKLSDEVLYPKEAFEASTHASKRGIGGIDTYKDMGYPFKDATKHASYLDVEDHLYPELLRGVLNNLTKIYPEARDFTDKIGIENFAGPEKFAQKANENIVNSSGFSNYQLETQFAAHKAAIERRFHKNIEEVVDAASVPISIEEYNATKGARVFTPLKNGKLFSDEDAAKRYAADIKLSGASRPGTVTSVMINGNEYFKVKLSFIDSSRYALREQQNKAIINADEWYNDIFLDPKGVAADVMANESGFVMVVPNNFKDSLTKSYSRSQSTALKILSGGGDFFKLMALSMNPRFATQQVVGGTVMLMMADPMHAGAVMAKFMEYSFRNMSNSVKRASGRTIRNEFAQHGSDYDIIFNRYVRDFEDNIYMEDAHNNFLNKVGTSVAAAQKARDGLNAGYTIAFAFEKNMRVAIIRKAALNYPGFKDFMDNNAAVGMRAAQGLPDMGYDSVSRFAAAFELLSDPKSPFYKARFSDEVRHTADMISGNYRDFTNIERSVRTYLVPFYAWTRHSALFNKRLIQERPLTANIVYNTGNEGYAEMFRRGGVPDWLVESVPMPRFMEDILGLDLTKVNRLGAGSINPLGVSANVAALTGQTITGDAAYGNNNLYDFTSPFVNAVVEQQTGRSVLTGVPTGSRSLLDSATSIFTSLPPIQLVNNSYKSYARLNDLRGYENPEDIFRDPFDPNSKLKTPTDKLNTKFPTLTPAGLFNAFAPVKAYSIDPKALGTALQREYTERGMIYAEKTQDMRKGVWRTISALAKWKATRDAINDVWFPEFGKDNPEMAKRVYAALQAQFPDIPSTFPASFVPRVLDGSLTVPDAVRQVVTIDLSARRAPVPSGSISGPIDTDVLTQVNTPDYINPIVDDAGTPTGSGSVSIDSYGFASVNGKPYIGKMSGRQVRYLVDEGGNVLSNMYGKPAIDRQWLSEAINALTPEEQRQVASANGLTVAQWRKLMSNVLRDGDALTLIPNTVGG